MVVKEITIAGEIANFRYKIMQTNKRPQYSYRQQYYVSRPSVHMPDTFSIYENGEYIFSVNRKSKHLLDNICKRGVPLTDAEKLVAELATNETVT